MTTSSIPTPIDYSALWLGIRPFFNNDPLFRTMVTNIGQPPPPLGPGVLAALAAASGSYSLGGTPVLTGGLTATGAVANDFSGSTGNFLLSTGNVTWTGASGKGVTFTATGAPVNLTGDATSTIKTTTGDVVVDGFAGIVWKMAGVQVLDIGVTTTTGFTVAPGKSWTFGGKLNASAAAYTIGDPGASGAIAVTADGVCPMVSAGAETRSLADPTYIGQKITLCCDTHGGDITVNAASAIDSAGHTHMAFTAAGQASNLVGITVAGLRKWRLQYNDGATLS